MASVENPAADRLYGPLARGFGRRVEEAVRLIGSRQAAATAMDISDDQVGKIIAERSVPNFAAMAALAERSGVSLYWLAFGRSPQLAGERLSTRTSFSEADGSGAAGTSFAPPSMVMVQRYDVRFAAGAGASVEGERRDGTMAFPRGYLEQVLHCAVGDVGIGEARGDSMEPTIFDRDLVMVNLKRREIADGEIFVLRLANDLVIKRVQREPDGSVLLMSDNKAYPNRRLTQAEADQVDVIGRMIWKGGAV